ncbi:MAG: type III pantothenate kinase [Bacteroidales bacterium]|nr:type III pantothenate kinase [Bacteroidales bacterium]
MLLAIDRGNTCDKFAVFDNDGTMICNPPSLLRKDFPPVSFKDGRFAVSDIINMSKCCDISACIFSSVTSEKENNDFVTEFNNICPCMQVTTETPLPFRNMYQCSTIGIDRLCAIAGAKNMVGNNVLVIDAGTCITYDYLDSRDVYCGGSISLGFKIKYNALHNFTANLPLITSIENTDLICNTTEKCIQSGVINGTIAEVEQTINLYKQKFANIKIVLTGGYGNFIKNNISHDVFEEKNLVLMGLKNIYELNEKNNK